MLLAGSTGMAESFTEGTQPFALVTAAGNEGDTLTVADSADAELAAWKANKSFQCVLVSAPGMQEGATYTLTVNGTATEFTASTTASGAVGGFHGRGGFGPEGQGEANGGDSADGDFPGAPGSRGQRSNSGQGQQSDLGPTGDPGDLRTEIAA